MPGLRPPKPAAKRFRKEGFWTRLLHNNVVFAIQRRLYLRGLPFMVLPVRVD